jgi:hypothetical protein
MVDIIHPVMTDLLCHILSREDYINPVAQLDQASDAKNLLDFLLTILEYDVPFSNRRSSIVDMNWRGRQFMLEVFAKMHNIPSLNTPYDAGSYALPLLLYILKDREVCHFRFATYYA